MSVYCNFSFFSHLYFISSIVAILVKLCKHKANKGKKYILQFAANQTVLFVLPVSFHIGIHPSCLHSCSSNTDNFVVKFLRIQAFEERFDNRYNHGHTRIFSDPVNYTAGLCTLKQCAWFFSPGWEELGVEAKLKMQAQQEYW